MPDITNSGCVILWEYNPSYTRITHATAVVEALKRGMGQTGVEDELRYPRGGFRLIDWSIAVHFGAERLRLRSRAQ